jgi:hypothetical protein
LKVNATGCKLIVEESKRSKKMMTLDPRSTKIIHEQKEKEILCGKEGNHINTYLLKLLVTLRCWFARIRQRLFEKSTRQVRYGVSGYNPCSE